MDLPLNALRAFEVSARHLSFTAAARELHLTQAAVSQHVKNLESELGVLLFRRVPRGLALTDEGAALVPVLTESFERMAAVLDGIRGGQKREVVSLGVVNTFAAGWLIPHLREFQQRYPLVDLRLFSNNNRVDLAAEGLDYAIRFGDGHWESVHAKLLLHAPLTPMCAPALARRVRTPRDLARESLLRSYRAEEWETWFRAAGVEPPRLTGSRFDSSLILANAAENGAGIALLPARLFRREVHEGRLTQLFDIEVDAGSYWLTRLKTRRTTPAMATFSQWILQEAPRST
ncbi:MAG TPA: LysR family transcriptional regulator [Polyangiaceae bacterium]|nr:LysR family transcriptional regulator [Polyangiaceae bacterium]